MKTTTCRKTRLPITVGRARDLGLTINPVGRPWAVRCDTHGAVLRVEYQTVAMQRATWPSWCEDCASELEGKRGARGGAYEVDPERLNVIRLEVPVRAQLEGVWGAHDLATLTRASLFEWLAGHPEGNTALVLRLLGHELGPYTGVAER